MRVKNVKNIKAFRGHNIEDWSFIIDSLLLHNYNILSLLITSASSVIGLDTVM